MSRTVVERREMFVDAALTVVTFVRVQLIEVSADDDGTKHVLCALLRTNESQGRPMRASTTTTTAAINTGTPENAT